MQTILKHRGELYLWLSLAIAFAVSLSFYRWHYSGTKVFLFLSWNLILAIIPFVITEIMLWTQAAQRREWFWLLALLWLIFFPNAPYILTDLFHLRPRQNIPFWYDLLLLLSYGFTGVFMGFLSLMTIEEIVARQYGRLLSNVVASVSLVACSVGIYVGRYLRWNSWDVLTKPQTLLFELTGQDFYPIQKSDILTFTIVFSIFLILNYVLLKKIMRLGSLASINSFSK
jgi:uncharacterized membrane protein